MTRSIEMVRSFPAAGPQGLGRGQQNVQSTGMTVHKRAQVTLVCEEGGLFLNRKDGEMIAFTGEQISVLSLLLIVTLPLSSSFAHFRLSVSKYAYRYISNLGTRINRGGSSTSLDDTVIVLGPHIMRFTDNPLLQQVTNQTKLRAVFVYDEELVAEMKHIASHDPFEIVESCLQDLTEQVPRKYIHDIFPFV